MAHYDDGSVSLINVLTGLVHININLLLRFYNGLGLSADYLKRIVKGVSPEVKNYWKATASVMEENCVSCKVAKWVERSLPNVSCCPG